MKKWTTWSLALALTFALWGGQDAQAQDEPAAAPGFVDENGDGIDDNARQRHRRGRRGVMKRRGAQSQIQSLLSETQQAELKALVEGMKEAEASHSDIRAAVEAQLVVWEIERPERPERPERSERGLNALLDEAQEAEIKTLIEGLKESEASRDDIRAAVNAKLGEWEIERPERGLDALLDEGQEAAIKGLIEGLKEAEASRSDVRGAVNAQLEEWGVERPERSTRKMGARGKHGRRGGFRGRGRAPAPEAPAAETTDAQ